ncbi:SDR family NAD(P)-dependent oxidoreductase [Planosporangium thailandense]|uniref:SDR family NAD(P)-dependent oxidoreductase n=1 Tax=Planosporangium thailandense TaxID=765197 RepID=A0ABX0Y0P0_9ACTN|nr:SDR family NAD(P)-dependent oxidoreductase [Planosporangium thailandense]NJC71893.1 SDR family NAD(P)-dependent oxidoreductase [Planosporangium thailandense]
MRVEAGQVAVVTGAASGIGRAMVDAFVARGLVVVLADVEKEALERAVAEVSATGATAEGHVVDVGTPDRLEVLADHVLSTYGRVDVICNNAGVVTSRRPVWEQSFADLEWTTRVNFYGVANGVRAFVPHMVRAGRGHVVNTASMAGLSTIPGGGNGVYSATKHAVIGLSETLAVELARAAPEVGVTVLCPGPVPSRIHDAARNRPASLVADPPATEPDGLPKPDFGLELQKVPAEVVAEQVVDAIESRRAYVVTAPDIVPLAKARVDALLSALAGEARNRGNAGDAARWGVRTTWEAP